MKNIFKKSAAAAKLVVFVLFMTAIAFCSEKTVFAAGSANINVSSASCTVGEETSVTVTITGDEEIYMCDFYLTYDSSILEAVSGYSDGGGGTIRILSTDQTAKTVKFTIKFKAKAAGSSKISISQSNSIIASDATDKMSISASAGTVTVKAPITYSADNNLSSLSISPGTLSPAFSPSVTSYTASVNADCTKLVVAAKANHSKASVSVSGTSLSVGTNNVTITVTAEDGSKKVYTIKTTRPQGATQAATQQATSQESQADGISEDESQQATSAETVSDNATITITGIKYEMYDNFNENPMPEGFTETEYNYEGTTVKAGRSTAGNLIIMYLYTDNEKGKSGWYIYDTVAKAFYEYNTVSQPQMRYVIFPITDSMEVFEGYERANAVINNQTVEVLKSESTDYCLFYGMNENGVSGWYMYDYKDKNIQRYIVAAHNKADESESSVTDEVSGSDVINNGADEIPWKEAAIALAVFSLIVLLLAVSFIIKASKLKKKLNEQLLDIDDKSDSVIKDKAASDNNVSDSNKTENGSTAESDAAESENSAAGEESTAEGDAAESENGDVDEESTAEGDMAESEDADTADDVTEEIEVTEVVEDVSLESVESSENEVQDDTTGKSAGAEGEAVEDKASDGEAVKSEAINDNGTENSALESGGTDGVVLMEEIEVTEVMEDISLESVDVDESTKDVENVLLEDILSGKQ